MNSIDFFYEDVEELQYINNRLKKQIKFLIKNENRKVGVISIIFCRDNHLLKINEEFLNHSYFTDIITFDYCENSFISGDLFISVDRVVENASGYSTSFAKELYRVIFHGILHLVGYKDKSEDDEKVMRTKEDYYLKGMDFDKGSV